MSFKVNDNKMLKMYTKIRETIRILMNIELDSEPVFGDKLNTNFQGKKIPKENASYKCFSIIILNSVIRVSKKYYPQKFLEGCKYEIKKTKMENLINDDLYSSSSGDETDNEFDDETEFDNVE